MSQGQLSLPTTGIVSGLSLAQDANTALQALASLCAGTSAPTASTTGLSSVAGLAWHDTANNLLKIRDQADSAWITLGFIDETNKLFLPYMNGLLLGTSLGGGGVNKLRNNTFQVWSRGPSGTVAAGANAYTADGWQVSALGASCSWAQIPNTGNNAPRYALKITGNTGVTDAAIYRKIESSDAAVMQGNQCTYQITILNETGAAITPYVKLYYANAADDFSGITLLQQYNTQSAANGGTTTLSYALNASAYAYQGLMIVVDFGSALAGSSAYVAIISDDFRITPGVAPGANPNPPPVEYLSIAAEVVRNARYLPAFIATGQQELANGFYSTTSAARLTVNFPTPTRAPTTGATASGAGIITVNGDSLAASTAITFGNAGTTSAQIEVSIPATGITAGHGCHAYFNGAGSLIFTGAEL